MLNTQVAEAPIQEAQPTAAQAYPNYSKPKSFPNLPRTWVRHTTQQMKNDRDGFSKQINLIRDDERTKRNEPGDMAARGIWTFANTSLFNYVPFCQMSCAIGLANVYNKDDMDELTQVAQKYGKPFLFSCVSKTLQQYALDHPERFKYLLSSESWMSGHSEVMLFTTI